VGKKPSTLTPKKRINFFFLSNRGILEFGGKSLSARLKKKKKNRPSFEMISTYTREVCPVENEWDGQLNREEIFGTEEDE